MPKIAYTQSQFRVEAREPGLEVEPVVLRRIYTYNPTFDGPVKKRRRGEPLETTPARGVVKNLGSPRLIAREGPGLSTN